MKQFVTHLALSALLLTVISACDVHGPNTTKLQYMPDMADTPTAKTQKSYLDPPDGSVTINAILYPETYEQAETELRNPFGENAQLSGDALKAGKVMYDTFCAVCHGLDGKGKGLLGDAYPIPVPDITRAELAARKDGFYFLRISNGGQMMPGYAYAISPGERWQLITYLRTLQTQPK